MVRISESSDPIDTITSGIDSFLPGIDSGSSSPLANGGVPNPRMQDKCTGTVLNAVNQKFPGQPLTTDNIQQQFMPFGGAWNLTLLANGLPPAQFNSIQTGRYPLNWWTYLIGYGATLHVTGSTYFNQQAVYSNNNIGGDTSVLFSTHIDTAFAYNPIGFLIHVIRDYLHIGGPRRPC